MNEIDTYSRCGGDTITLPVEHALTGQWYDLATGVETRGWMLIRPKGTEPVEFDTVLTRNGTDAMNTIREYVLWETNGHRKVADQKRPTTDSTILVVIDSAEADLDKSTEVMFLERDGLARFATLGADGGVHVDTPRELRRGRYVLGEDCRVTVFASRPIKDAQARMDSIYAQTSSGERQQLEALYERVMATFDQNRIQPSDRRETVLGLFTAWVIDRLGLVDVTMSV